MSERAPRRTPQETAAALAVVNATADEIDALRKERDALRARVEVLEGALSEADGHLVVAAGNAWDASRTDQRWVGVYQKLTAASQRARAALEDK